MNRHGLLSRRATEGRPLRVALIGADMRSFDLGRRFPLATVPFRPFQHLLTVDDQLACLATIRRHLSDNGRLVFDLFNPSLDLLANNPLGVESSPEPEFVAPDGRRVVRCYRTVAQDRFQQTGSHELIYDVTHSDGSKERLVHAFTWGISFASKPSTCSPGRALPSNTSTRTTRAAPTAHNTPAIWSSWPKLCRFSR